MSDRVRYLAAGGTRMEAPVSLALERGRAVCFCDAPTRDADDPNQDSLAVLETSYGGIVLAVADGVGGHAAGEEASRLAIDALAQAVLHHATTPLRTVILDAFEVANREVIALGKGAATTLSVVEIGEDGLRSYHAGDSQTMVVGQRGRLKFSSMAHSPVGYALEAGFLDDREAMVHEERHLISNLVGSESMNIQIGPHLHLSPYDTVVTGSDGIFDNASRDEIVRRVRKGPLDRATTSLVDHCLARMRGERQGPSKPDDLALVIYRPRASR